jgi:hypothetical protein
MFRRSSRAGWIVGSNLPIFGHAIGSILEHYPRATMREGDVDWYRRLLRLARRGIAFVGPGLRLSGVLR